MDDPDSDTDGPRGEVEDPTSIFPTEVFDVPVDPLLNLLNQWEEYRGRGEEPPPEWTVAIDAGLREELNRRIERRKRLIALLDLSEPPSDEEPGPDEPLPSFPGHETLNQIGRGGMGAVYRARDLVLERIVAIKTIAEGRFAGPDQRERFRAEARAIARLHHPNIIAIHAIGEHDRQPFLTLEFAEGGSLATRLAVTPMAPREAAALLETLARAVHAAHRAGVLHRDLKPSNILLTAQGVPKISDFGLAKLMDADCGSHGHRPGPRLAQLHGARAGGRPLQTRRPGRGYLRAGLDPLPGPHGPAAIPGRVAARDAQAGRLQRGRPSLPAAARRPARPGDDLPEVPGEGAGAAVRRRPGPGR